MADFIKFSMWQQIFLQSKANGAPYHGDQLPAWEWKWPKDTFLQRRLRELRRERRADDSIHP